MNKIWLAGLIPILVVLTIGIVFSSVSYSRSPKSTQEAQSVFQKAYRAIVTTYSRMDEFEDQYVFGSGFFVSSDGFLVTTASNTTFTTIGVNTLSDSTRKKRIWVTVTNWDGTEENRTVEAEVISVDGAGDVAVLKVHGLTHQPYLEFGNNRDLSPGNVAYSIGDAVSLDHLSCTKGVIRDAQHTLLSGTLPTETVSVDLPIMANDPGFFGSHGDTSNILGSPGSPILNSQGEVVAIISRGLVYDSVLHECFSSGMGSFVMRHVVSRIIEDYRNGTNIWTNRDPRDYNRKGFLGMRWFTFYPKKFLEEYNLDFGFDATASFDWRGVVIYQICPEGAIAVYNAQANPSDQISERDLLLSIDGVDLGLLDHQVAPGSVTWFKRAGDTVVVEFYQMSTLKIKKAELTLQRFPSEYDIPLNSDFNV